jgi:hypothetical protein
MSLLSTEDNSTTETTEAVTETTETTTETVADVQQSDDRPEWLPEKFKSAEDLGKAYKELEGKLGKKEEDLRAAILEELNNDAFKDRPETAGDYQLPDYVDPEASVDNKLLDWWSKHSFENGYSQAEFEQGLQVYMEAVGANQGPDLEAEAKALGDNANQRIEAASAFANKFFPKEAIGAVERMCETHDGIIALEAIMDAMKDGNFAGSTENVASNTEAELQEMMKDERYWNPAKRDANFVNQVNAGFKKLYG